MNEVGPNGQPLSPNRWGRKDTCPTKGKKKEANEGKRDKKKKGFLRGGVFPTTEKTGEQTTGEFCGGGGERTRQKKKKRLGADQQKTLTGGGGWGAWERGVGEKSGPSILRIKKCKTQE